MLRSWCERVQGLFRHGNHGLFGAGGDSLYIRFLQHGACGRGGLIEGLVDLGAGCCCLELRGGFDSDVGPLRFLIGDGEKID